MRRPYILLILSFFACQFIYAQEVFYPLNSNAWKPLIKTFASKQVVGLGEATHGTTEFYQQRVALSKFLINECGYRIIIWEAGFLPMLSVNEYVSGLVGDPDSLLRNVGYWLYYNREVSDFLVWVREFNNVLGDSAKVQIYGMDILAGGKVDSSLMSRWENVAEQNLLFSRQAGVADGNFRDSCMAANVSYILAATKQKAIVWAHNGHIARADTIMKYPAEQLRMGERLHQQLGNMYYPVGFFLQSGECLVMNSQLKDGKLIFPNFRKHRLPAKTKQQLITQLSLKYPQGCVVDIRSSNEKMFHQPQNVYYVGSFVTSETFTQVPALSFDAMLLVPTTSATMQIDDHFNKTIK